MNNLLKIVFINMSMWMREVNFELTIFVLFVFYICYSLCLFINKCFCNWSCKKKYKNSLFILSMVLFEKLYDSMILFGNYTTTDAVPIVLL